LDAVEHCSSKARPDAAIGANEILEQNRRRGPIAGTNVLQMASIVELLGVMIDDEVDLFGRVRKMRRLKVDDGDMMKALERAFRDLFDFDLQQFNHRDIFRPRDPTERPERGRLFVASENLTQGEAASNGVRVRIILKQD